MVCLTGLTHWLLTSTGALVEVPLPYPELKPKYDRGVGISAFVLVLVSLPSIPVSALMITLGRRVIVRAAPVAAADTVPSVVYLRSFADDRGVLSELLLRCRSVLRGARFDDNVWGEDYSPTGATPEEWLVSAFAGHGSFLAIGRPGERWPPLGAARIYVGDNWQEVVKELIAGAHTVIVRLGSSAGLWWEIETVLAGVPRERILFQLPEWGLFGIQRRRAYREFRRRTRHLLRHPLPPGCLFVRFIAFDETGKAVMMRPSWWRILFWPVVSPEKSFRSALNYKLGKP